MARMRQERLRARDMADFEKLVDRALISGTVGQAVRDDPTGGLVHRLRIGARAEAPLIAEHAATEYRAYLALRGDAAEQESPGGTDDGRAGHGGGRGLLPLLGVMVPSLAGVAAAVFYLLGSVLRLGASQRALGDALIAAAQVAVVVTAVSLACAVAGLLAVAARHRASGESGREARLRRARESWQRALLQRGIVPYLEHRVREEAGAGEADRASDAARTRSGRDGQDGQGGRDGQDGRDDLGGAETADAADRSSSGQDSAGRDSARPDSAGRGYASPGYASPDYASPDYASPDYASPDYASPDFQGPRSSSDDR